MYKGQQQGGSLKAGGWCTEDEGFRRVAKKVEGMAVSRVKTVGLRERTVDAG